MSERANVHDHGRGLLALTDLSGSGPAASVEEPQDDGRVLDLAIGGMTCASCAGRVERALNRLDGVSASVNLATEQARVHAGHGTTDQELLDAVAATGYSARLPHPAHEHDEHAGHDHMHDDDTPLGLRLLLSVVLGVPVVVLSMVTRLQFSGWEWVALALATPVVVWSAWPFHQSALVNARHLASTMDTLVSLGITAAYGWSLVSVLRGTGHLYLEVATAVTVFLLTGRTLEARARTRTGSAMTALAQLGVRDVSVLKDGQEGTVSITELTAGDEFVTRPGEQVATDGVVLDGESEIDQSMLTGEALPVSVAPGDHVTGATINGPGRLVVRATQVGEQTRLAQITRLVQDAQAQRAPVQRLADQVSAVFVPVVLALAFLTLITWLLIGNGPDDAFTAAVAVLIIACPCALGLATPVALLAGTGRGAERGILVRGPSVLEVARRLDTVVFDKTGTLTQGQFSVVSVTGPELALRLAGAVENAGQHPLGAAIVAAARERGELLAASKVQNTPGMGMSANVHDHGRVLVGRPGWVTESGTPSGSSSLPAELADAFESAERAGLTAVAVGWDGVARAVIALADVLKPDAARAVLELRSLGLRPVMLTGDNQTTAVRVGQDAGIHADDVIAGVTPEGKLDAIRALQAQGHRVAMVGDGINDAAALAAADLGIAMGSGTDTAIAAADITLMRSQLTAVPQAIQLSRTTLRVIRQNLAWAFGYNVAALPLAAAGLLNPMIAGAAMAFSSLAVVLNALRLRRA